MHRHTISTRVMPCSPHYSCIEGRWLQQRGVWMLTRATRLEEWCTAGRWGSLMSAGSALELTRTSMGKVTVFVPCVRMCIRLPLTWLRLTQPV